jgi:small-conductance mechanosensitive channel
LNTSFSNSGCNSNFNFYNLDWSNQSDFSWSAQTIGNYAPKFKELHHSDYPQFDHQAQSSAYQALQPAPQSSLEDTLKAFMQSTDKNLQALTQSISKSNQELKNTTMANSRYIQELKSYTTQAMSRLEGQINYLVTELNRIEEEEL